MDDPEFQQALKDFNESTRANGNETERESMILKHQHQNVSIEKMVEIAVLNSITDKSVKQTILQCDDEQVRIKKECVLPKSIAKLIGIHYIVPYEEITLIDDQNRIFTMETHIRVTNTKKNTYSLDVITEFAENELDKVDVTTKLHCNGIKKLGLIHMTLKAQVKERFKAARQYEAVQLLKR